MRAFLKLLRLLAALCAALLAVRAWMEGFAATGDISLAIPPREPFLAGVRAVAPDDLQRFVLLRFAQGSVLAVAALFFLRSVYRSEVAPRAGVLANAVALALFGCAGALFVHWGLGYTVLTYFGNESAYACLARAEEFAGTAVGIAGTEPETVRAFRELASRPQSTVAFLQLVAFGTPAGRVYGLCGLRRSAPPLFRIAVRPFLHSRQEVRTFFGCILSREPMSKLVRAEQGIRLVPGQSLHEWGQIHCRPGKGCSPALEFDVFGGTYSSMFLDPAPLPPVSSSSPSS